MYLQGPVSFRNRQRRAETIIKQFQYDLTQEIIRIVAEYSSLNGFSTNCSECQPHIWPGNKRDKDSLNSVVFFQM